MVILVITSSSSLLLPFIIVTVFWHLSTSSPPMPFCIDPVCVQNFAGHSAPSIHTWLFQQPCKAGRVTAVMLVGKERGCRELGWLAQVTAQAGGKGGMGRAGNETQVVWSLLRAVWKRGQPCFLAECHHEVWGIFTALVEVNPFLYFLLFFGIPTVHLRM